MSCCAYGGAPCSLLMAVAASADLAPPLIVLDSMLTPLRALELPHGIAAAKIIRQGRLFSSSATQRHIEDLLG